MICPIKKRLENEETNINAFNFLLNCNFLLCGKRWTAMKNAAIECST